MPLSTLDPTPALVAIDLQKGTVSGHRHSIERVFPKLGETATSAEIIDFLDR